MTFDFDAAGNSISQPSAGGFDFDADGTPVIPPSTAASDTARGFKTAFQQLPQLGYGLVAGAGAALENVAGEGGIASGIKKAGVKGYQEWGDKIAATAKESDSLSYSWERAKEGDFGALADWLQYGLGYAGGQAVQMLATGGVGSLVGKAALSTTAEKVASGMVAKEAARIAATDEGKKLATDQLAKLATANVAAKIGQTTAIGTQAFGMEGGEIFGGLVSDAEKEGRQVSGGELAKAFGATIGAGALEFVGDKIGLDLMLGKSALVKPLTGMAGTGGRVARGVVGAAAAAPIEGGTEYLQTGVEAYGQGKEASPLTWRQSAESRQQAIDAAGLGALGGAAMGGAGGALTPPRQAVATPAEQPAAAQPTVQTELQPAAPSLAETVSQVLDAPSLDAAIAAAQDVVATPDAFKGRLSAIAPAFGEDLQAALRADLRVGNTGTEQLLADFARAQDANVPLAEREAALAKIESLIQAIIAEDTAPASGLPDMGGTFERSLDAIRQDADAVKEERRKDFEAGQVRDASLLPAALFDAERQDRIAEAAGQAAPAPTAMAQAMDLTNRPSEFLTRLAKIASPALREQIVAELARREPAAPPPQEVALLGTPLSQLDDARLAAIGQTRGKAARIARAELARRNPKATAATPQGEAAAAAQTPPAAGAARPAPQQPSPGIPDRAVLAPELPAAVGGALAGPAADEPAAPPRADRQPPRQGTPPAVNPATLPDSGATITEGALRSALSSATRTSRISGMVGDAVPDPIAQDLLHRQESLRQIAARLAELGITGLRPLAGGASSVVLDAGERVVRLGFGDVTSRPNIPEVLQADAAGAVGGVRYEVLPKVDTAGIGDTDVATMDKALRARGYAFSDPGSDNLGRLNGNLVVTDPGSITKSATAETPTGEGKQRPRPAQQAQKAAVAPARPSPLTLVTRQTSDGKTVTIAQEDWDRRLGLIPLRDAAGQTTRNEDGNVAVVPRDRLTDAVPPLLAKARALKAKREAEKAAVAPPTAQSEAQAKRVAEEKSKFELAKERSETAIANSKAAAAVLEAFPKGRMGLTPDEVKASPEWKAAKAAFDRAFAEERAANKALLDAFPKEIRAERDATRAARVAARADEPAPAVAATPEESSAVAPVSEMDRLKTEMGQAIGELASLLGAKSNLTPEEETAILPVMSKIFRIAAQMGYQTFADAGRYVYQQIKALAGGAVASKLDIGNLQAGFINTVRDTSPDPKAAKLAALAFDSIDELMATAPQTTTEGDRNAVQKPGAARPDVRQAPANREAMGAGDAEEQAPAETRQGPSQKTGAALSAGTVTAPKATSANQVSLLHFLKAQGGLSAAKAIDLGGDKAHILNRRLPGLFRKQGLSADAAREVLQQHGWLAGVSDDEQLVRTRALISDALRGNAPVRQETEAVALLEAEAEAAAREHFAAATADAAEERAAIMAEAEFVGEEIPLDELQTLIDTAWDNEGAINDTLPDWLAETEVRRRPEETEPAGTADRAAAPRGEETEGEGFDLAGQTLAEVEAQEAARQAAEGQEEPLSKAQIDLEAAGFSLTGESQANARQAPTGGQDNLFTPDGRATQAADVAQAAPATGKRPLSEIEYNLRQLAKEATEQGKRVEWMTPDEYLSLSPEMKPNEGKLSRLRESFAKGDQLREIPSLAVEVNDDGTGGVVFQEGRHRTTLLKEAGVKRIPVIIGTSGADVELQSIRGQDRDTVFALEKTEGSAASQSAPADQFGDATEMVGEAPPDIALVAKSAKIADMGEKIGGAKKDLWATYNTRMRDAQGLDVTAEPLSKSWPTPDYQALLDAGADPWAVGFMRAARDAVPAKPRMAYKVKRWAEQVRTLRDTASQLADGSLSVARAKELLREMATQSRSMSDLQGRVELYQLVGHEKSLDGVRISYGEYSIYEGVEYKPARIIWSVEKETAATAFSNWPRMLATGATKAEALANFKAKYDTMEITPPVAKEVTFDLYVQGNQYYVGKKLGRNILQLAGPFAALKEARAYRTAHQAELAERLAKAKEIPKTRRDTNEPRVGEDMRNGQDVTPELFMESFGFKSMEFGNWVEQKKRQKDLNESFDALMDMAAILDVPPRALSLNGELSIAFGARGSGGVEPAAAHYERDKIVINLTKKEGAGSLGHEWFHAVDNYFSRLRAKGGDMATEALDVSLADRGSDFVANTALRREMVQAFGEVMRTIRLTAIKARASKLDAKRSREYWTTKPEMAARAFESYLITKLQDHNASNDYLANIVDEATWKAAESLGFELDDSYPYPTAGEIPAIRAAFDKMFAAIETKETEQGIAMFRRGAEPLDAVTLTTLRRQAAALERPQDGVFLRVTADGQAIATGPKGTKIPEAFLRFAADHDLEFVAQRSDVRQGSGTVPAGEVTEASEAMPPAHREAGAIYFGETGPKLDRTGLSRFRSTPETPTVAVDADEAEAIVARIRDAYPGQTLRLVESFAQLPSSVRRDAEAQEAGTGIRGTLDRDGVIWVVRQNNRDAADVEATVFHELLGHVGIRKLLGQDFIRTLNQLYFSLGGVEGLIRIAEQRGFGGQLASYLDGVGQAHAKDPERFTRRIAQSILTEEVFAHLAEQQPKLLDRAKALLGQIRAWLRSHGFLKLAAYGETDLLHLLRQAEAGLRAPGGRNAQAGLTAFSRGETTTHAQDLQFAAEALNELSFEDAAFRYPISTSNTLEGNVLAAMPGAEYLGEDTRPDEREESLADRRFVFAAPNGKIFYVFTKGNEVWIDVSRLQEGDRGSAIYHGVANYAYNTGKVFVGDPNGLSEDAVIRRTAAMLSSALRFGTTQHLAPAREQLEGAPEKGIEPLVWKDGDDVANVKSLIHTYLETLQQKFPAIRNYRYDFGRVQFVDARGRPVDAARLNLGAASPNGRASRSGEASLRRGILLQSLASSTGSERPGILEELLRRSAQLVSDEGGLKAVFRRGEAPVTSVPASPSRRDFLKAGAALAGWAALNPVQAFAAAPAPLSSLLRKNDLRGALDWVASQSGNAAYRDLAKQVKALLPATVKLQTIGVSPSPNGGLKFSDPAPPSLASSYGLSKIDRAKGTVTLYLRDSATESGLNETTLLHEAIHAAIQARYDLLNIYGANPGAFGSRAADPAITTYLQVWREFREVAAKEAGGDNAPAWLSEPYDNPDEFLTYALTEPKLQAWLKAREYQGKTLWERFKGAVTKILGFTVKGQAPSWLDAALTVSHDLLAAARKDAPDFAVAKEIKRRLGDRAAADAETVLARREAPVTPTGRSLPGQLRQAIGDLFDTTSEPARPRAAGSVWDTPTPSKMDDALYSLQDKQIDTKRVIEAVKEASGGIADEWNPYLQEELFHGRSAKGVKDFLDLELRPLLQEMQARKVAMSDFEEYLWNRHAEERNAQIAKINEAMPDGGSGIATADARAYLANLTPQQQATYERLAKRIDAINAKTRQLLIDSGLEKSETIAAWEGAYQHYVPLQREDMDTGGIGTGQGFSIRGSASKRAVGSGKPVADILGNIAMQREKTIVRTEKNRVSNALFGLVKQQPNPEFWSADEAPTERVVATIGGEDKVVERVVPGFRNQDNVLLTRINGEDHYVVFNEREPRALRMALAMKNLDADQLGRVLSAAGRATRYLAAINTQYNPIFGIVNLIRDVQSSLLNLSTTPIKGEQKKVLGYTVDALRGIYADMRAHRKGQVPSSKWAQLWEEFQKEGGQTGYRDQYANAEARAEAIAKEIASVDRNFAVKTGGAIFDWLSDYNETMENAVRLAAYRAAKESGQSNSQAASIAKNISVNFNRKGVVATQVGALYAFFNASVQGTARLAETLRGPMGRRIIYGGLLLGAMQAALLAAAGMGDDEPPEFVRERNLILPIGDGKYLSLPMPLGFHVLPNIGRIPVEFVLSGFKQPSRRVADFLGVFADTFNPIGNAGLSLQTIAPTVVDPLAALAENRDWTGKPIAKADMNALAPTPGHLRAKDTATTWSKAISYGLNLLSGGTDYQPGLVSPTPDQIDYLIGQATGGVGRELSKLEQAATAAISGEEMPLYKVPLVGKFVGDTAGQSAEGGKFYAALRRLNGHEAEIKGLRKEGKGAEAMAYIRGNPEAKLVPFANAIERQVQRLRRAKREAVEAGNSGRVRAIEQQITAKMAQLNARVRSMEERAG